MSNDNNTADKRIAGERTVKKKAARNVVVSPVNVKSSGTPKNSKELTAPIGLVWNEDTTQAVKAAPKKTASKPPARPMITGTGWPDKPPVPKVNRPDPIKYKPVTRVKEEASKKEESPARQETPVRGQESGDQKHPARQVQQKAPAGNRNQTPAKQNGPARIQAQAKQRGSVRNQAPVQQNGPSRNQAPLQPNNPARNQAPAIRQERPMQQRPVVQDQNRPAPADNPLKQNGVLYSPVSAAEERMPISPMQKRPADTQVWEGPIQQIPGYGIDGYGPKFVRTVVTTTTTTYEPVTEDVIRQITSQTSPVALTENVLNQPPAMPPLPGQASGQQAPAQGRSPVMQQGQTGRPPVRQQAPGQQARQGQVPTGRPGQAPIRDSQGRQIRPQGQPGRPPVRQQNPGQQVPGQQGRQAQQQGRPPVRQQTPGQQAPGQVPAGQKQSIIGAMESRGPGKPQTGMNRQLAEIEKALGLTGQPAEEKTDGLTEAIIKNAAVDPGMNNTGINNTGMNNPAGNGPQGPNTGNKPVPAGSPVQDPESESKKSMEYMMLFVEGIIFLIVLAICISIFLKIKKGSSSADTSTPTAVEETQPAQEEDTGDEGTEDFETQEADSGDILDSGTELLEGDSEGSSSTAPSGSVDVDNDKFTLKCTNVTVKLDTDGNPAALIYFTFANRTSEQLAVADVFPISVTQNGEPCDTFAALDEYPEEYYNKDMKISDGSELSCAYAVSLKDAVSPIILTVHDEHDTMTDVGTTEIALQ